MPYDEPDDVFTLRPRHRTVHRFQPIHGQTLHYRRDAGHTQAPDAIEAYSCSCGFRIEFDRGTTSELRDELWRRHLSGTILRDRDAAEKAELDEWRATYGRLDIPVTVIDWRPVYAGAAALAAALAIALVARWVVRHGG